MVLRLHSPRPRSTRVSRRPPVGYSRILVPVTADGSATTAVDLACRLAADKGATVRIVAVVEIPELLPFDAQMDVEEDEAHELLERCRALADSYGVRVETDVCRAREAAAAIVDDACCAAADMIVMGHASRLRPGSAGHRIGATARHVLLQAPCRVTVVRPNN